MKWIGTVNFVVVLFLFTNVLWAQLVIDNFDYATGDLTTVSGGVWVNHSGTGSFIQVTDGNLSYPGYMTATGRKINIVNGSGSREDVHTLFAAQSGSAKVYASMLVNVTAAGTGAYFFHFMNGNNFKGRVWVTSSGSGIQFGLSGDDDIPTNVPTIFNLNQTYLIVLSYEFDPSGADIVRLWVNPDLSGPEPSADVQLSPNSDFTSFGQLGIRQAGGTLTASLDGLRIGTSWGDSPLPVELASFTAVAGDGKVTLRWATQSEVNNERFEIMRSETKEGDYNQIGERPGQFNSNQLTYYSFEDHFVANGTTYWYKLVDVDVNGVRTEHGPVSATPQASGTEITTIDSEVPRSYRLYPAYPNPFNPSTNLKFDVPSTFQGLAEVTVEVYNSLGQRVRSLFSGTVEAGTYALTWDGTTDNGIAVPGGVYFAVMKSGFYKNTVKMALVK